MFTRLKAGDLEGFEVLVRFRTGCREIAKRFTEQVLKLTGRFENIQQLFRFFQRVFREGDAPQLYALALLPDVVEDLVNGVANRGDGTETGDRDALFVVDADRNGTRIHADNHAAVITAERIIVLHEEVDFPIAEVVRHVVQIAVRTRVIEVQRRQHAVIR